MSKNRLWKRWVLFLALVTVGGSLSACYRDAGQNVQPTSNRVQLNDILPTTVPPPVILSTATPVPYVVATATRTLVPTTTPADSVPVNPPVTTPTSAGGVTGPVNTPQLAPSFTPMIPAQSPTSVGIATPGMSDIQPSATSAPTLNPALQPTPTSIPVEQNPCIHVVKSGDTAYSIARDNNVDLGALVAANPSLFGGNQNAVLQIGWEIQIPGCSSGTPTAQPTTGSSETSATPSGEQPTPASGTVTHVVQPGETLYSIARQYGVSPQAIIDANPLKNPNLIYPGDTLIIPLGQ